MKNLKWLIVTAVFAIAMLASPMANASTLELTQEVAIEQTENNPTINRKKRKKRRAIKRKRQRKQCRRRARIRR
jgi:Ni/Co efflux regulator RcnB